MLLEACKKPAAGFTLAGRGGGGDSEAAGTPVVQQARRASGGR